ETYRCGAFANRADYWQRFRPNLRNKGNEQRWKAIGRCRKNELHQKVLFRCCREQGRQTVIGCSKEELRHEMHEGRMIYEIEHRNCITEPDPQHTLGPSPILPEKIGALHICRYASVTTNSDDSNTGGSDNTGGGSRNKDDDSSTGGGSRT